MTDGALEAVLRRDRLIVAAALGVIAALAWTYVLWLAADMNMDGMQMGGMSMSGSGMAPTGIMGMIAPAAAPWSAVEFAFMFVMWAVMMVGMMGPSATPMILLFAAAQSKRENRRAALPAGAFAMGYVFVWTAFSAGAAVAQWALHQTALLSPAMAVLSPRIGGAVLIAAGVYQMTPWKSACLTHCRSPLSFLMAHWREGGWGAFGIGAHHGAYCLGCCWALMIVLFVVGVMNLVWVAVLAAFVLLEKAGPYGTAIARISGAALILYGIVMIA